MEVKEPPAPSENNNIPKYFPTKQNNNNTHTIKERPSPLPSTDGKDLIIHEDRASGRSVPKPLTMLQKVTPSPQKPIDFVATLADKKNEWTLQDKTLKNTNKNASASSSSGHKKHSNTESPRRAISEAHNNNNKNHGVGNLHQRTTSFGTSGSDGDEDDDDDDTSALAAERLQRKQEVNSKVNVGYAVAMPPRGKIKIPETLPAPVSASSGEESPMLTAEELTAALEVLKSDGIATTRFVPPDSGPAGNITSSPPFIKGDKSVLSNQKSNTIRAWIQDYAFNSPTIELTVNQRYIAVHTSSKLLCLVE